jgi:hypothetical protein
MVGAPFYWQPRPAGLDVSKWFDWFDNFLLVSLVILRDLFDLGDVWSGVETALPVAAIVFFGQVSLSV